MIVWKPWLDHDEWRQCWFYSVCPFETVPNLQKRPSAEESTCFRSNKSIQWALEWLKSLCKALDMMFLMLLRAWRKLAYSNQSLIWLRHVIHRYGFSVECKDRKWKESSWEDAKNETLSAMNPSINEMHFFLPHISNTRAINFSSVWSESNVWYHLDVSHAAIKAYKVGFQSYIKRHV